MLQDAVPDVIIYTALISACAKGKQQQRALTHGQLHMDAQRVWGSVSGTAASGRAEPMVFDLSRISAESMTHSMAEIAAAVSQEVTGAEERVALERSGPVQPVVGVRVEAPVDPGVVVGTSV